MEISRGSVIEIDAAIEAMYDLNYVTVPQLEQIGKLLNSSFAMLTKMTY